MNLFQPQTTEPAVRKSILTVGQDLTSIMFPVEQRRLKHYTGGKYINTDVYGIFRVDDDEMLYAGSQYTIVSNEEIISHLKPIQEQGFELVDVRNFNNKKFEMNFINPDHKFNVGGEESNLRMKIVNSYDGSASLFMALGAYLNVCSNGCVWGQAATYKHKHTKQIDIPKFLENAMEEHFTSVSNNFEGKKWHTEEAKVETQYKELASGWFVKDKENKDKPNYAAKMLQERFHHEYKTYNESAEFALFMAATFLGTHGHNKGLGVTYQEVLNTKVPKVFFNKSA